MPYILPTGISYARWQCYINNEQYVNSNTYVVQNTEWVTVIQNVQNAKTLILVHKDVGNRFKKKAEEMKNRKYQKIEQGPSKPIARCYTGLSYPDHVSNLHFTSLFLNTCVLTREVPIAVPNCVWAIQDSTRLSYPLLGGWATQRNGRSSCQHSEMPGLDLRVE
jgi:hypothetical protein